jgi:hypothetical protein
VVAKVRAAKGGKVDGALFAAERSLKVGDQFHGEPEKGK